MILSVSEPTWDKKSRHWVLKIKIDDKEIGIYEQEMAAEALISITNIRSQIVEIMKRQRT